MADADFIAMDYVGVALLSLLLGLGVGGSLAYCLGWRHGYRAGVRRGVGQASAVYGEMARRQEAADKDMP